MKRMHAFLVCVAVLYAMFLFYSWVCKWWIDRIRQKRKERLIRRYGGEERYMEMTYKAERKTHAKDLRAEKRMKKADNFINGALFGQAARQNNYDNFNRSDEHPDD